MNKKKKIRCVDNKKNKRKGRMQLYGILTLTLLVVSICAFIPAVVVFALKEAEDGENLDDPSFDTIGAASRADEADRNDAGDFSNGFKSSSKNTDGASWWPLQNASPIDVSIQPSTFPENEGGFYNVYDGAFAWQALFTSQLSRFREDGFTPLPPRGEPISLPKKTRQVQYQFGNKSLDLVQNQQNDSSSFGACVDVHPLLNVWDSATGKCFAGVSATAKSDANVTSDQSYCDYAYAEMKSDGLFSETNTSGEVSDGFPSAFTYNKLELELDLPIIPGSQLIGYCTAGVSVPGGGRSSEVIITV